MIRPGHVNSADPLSVAENAPLWRETTGRIIGCAIEVHRHLGPGLLERLYEDALEYELRRAGAQVDRQHSVRVPYKDIQLSAQRLDMVVDHAVIVELKCVDKVSDVHLATLVSYLRATSLPLGLLINFNVPTLKQGVYRRINSAARAVIQSPASSATSAFNAL